jgi:Fe-S cluster assembly protein SufD
MTRSIDDNVTSYLLHFEQFEAKLNGGSRETVHGLRKNAIEQFSKNGFPTTKMEEWRFTNMAPVRNTGFLPAFSTEARSVRIEDVEKHSMGRSDVCRLVFVNGLFQVALSSPVQNAGGMYAGSLAAASPVEREVIGRNLGSLAGTERSPFTALNTAFLYDGAYIRVGDGIDVTTPIHLLFFASTDERMFVAHPRNLIVVGKGSRLSIIESYVGLQSTPYFTNVVTEMFVGEGSNVEHDKLQTEYAGAYHVGSAYIRLDARSSMTSNSISLGASIVRNEIHALLGGEHAECTLNGLSLATGTQLVDNHTAIDHAVPDCSSHELYKSILDGKSHGVFNGKIFVRKDAQKTDAKQTNKTLLLSDEATIDTKPQLEIFADDVKCTHGATVGQLDEDQVFYLRARGIGLEEARDMLTFAFARDVVNRIHVDDLRTRLEEMIRTRLNRGRLSGE